MKTTGRLRASFLDLVAAATLLASPGALAQTITPIHDVQGPGASSPIVGASVTVRATVTGVRAGHLDRVAPRGGNPGRGASGPDHDPPLEYRQATAFAFAGPAHLVARKSVTGDFRAGGSIAYSIVISNQGPGTQFDNPGDEFTDNLPAGLTLVGASASPGTASTAGNTVTWNGTLGPNASATVTIDAVIDITIAPAAVIANQATLAYDGDGNGTNDAPGVSDDPATTASDDPTAITTSPLSALEVPTLGAWGFSSLIALLALTGAATVRRR